jgi:hypothetical protein
VSASEFRERLDALLDRWMGCEQARKSPRSDCRRWPSEGDQQNRNDDDNDRGALLAGDVGASHAAAMAGQFGQKLS